MGVFSRSPEFRAGVFSRYFFRVGRFWGSVAGRGVLNTSAVRVAATHPERNSDMISRLLWCVDILNLFDPFHQKPFPDCHLQGCFRLSGLFWPQSLVHRNRVISSICDCDWHRRPQKIEWRDVRGTGPGVRPPPRGGPGNHPLRVRCPLGVCAVVPCACDIVWYVVCPFLSFKWCPVLFHFPRVGQVSEQPQFGVKVTNCFLLSILACWGRFP